jgi:hypothetical protein
MPKGHQRHLGGAGFEVMAKVPPVRYATGSSPRTASASTSGHNASPVRPVNASPSTLPVTVADVRRACTKSRAGRTITIGPHEDLSKWRGPNRQPPSGRRALGPTAPRSSASSPTSCGAVGVDATHGCGDAAHRHRRRRSCRGGQSRSSGRPRTGPGRGSIERGRAVGALRAPPWPARVPGSWLPRAERPFPQIDPHIGEVSAYCPRRRCHSHTVHRDARDALLQGQSQCKAVPM